MNRYTDPASRYSPYTGASSYMQAPSSGVSAGISNHHHISAHTDPYHSPSGYGIRYPDYNRYPTYSTGGTSTATGGGGINPTSPTSPRWRRRSYDPDYMSRRSASTTRPPLSDLVGSATAGGVGTGGSVSPAGASASSVLMRSRSRSRVTTEYDPNAYLRYMSPSSYSTTRPISGYIYGHSYSPSTAGGGMSMTGSAGASNTMSSYHTDPTISATSTMARMGAQGTPPGPPPNYNAMDREVSARVRRYQQQQADPSS